MADNWIMVEMRLPEKQGWYKAKSDGKEYQAFYTPKNPWSWAWSIGPRNFIQPTHWQPIEPPETTS